MGNSTIFNGETRYKWAMFNPKTAPYLCRASKELVQFPEVEDTAPKGGVVRSLYECKTSFAFVEYNIVDMQYIYIYLLYIYIH